MPCWARYLEDTRDSGDGDGMFVYAILLFIGGKYVMDELKKGGAQGAQAAAIVGGLGVAAYMFPIINGILVAVAALAFAYAMFTKGRR